MGRRRPSQAQGRRPPPLAGRDTPTGYIPDFLTPAPTATLSGIDGELEAVRATSPEDFVDEVAWMAGDQGTPAAWRQEAALLHRRMLAEPEKAVAQLTELLFTYWKLAIEPHWRRMHGVLQSDIRARMRVVESAGSASVFSSLHERIGWRDNQLTIRSSYTFHEALGGQGIILVPSIFCGPEVLTMLPPLQSMIVYPRPGVTDLWQNHGQSLTSPLAALLGSVRAAVLVALAVPVSTGELAAEIDVTPGAISQHLAVLRGCSLVTSQRAGRRVIHSLTETGEELVRGAGHSPGRSALSLRDSADLDPAKRLGAALTGVFG